MRFFASNSFVEDALLQGPEGEQELDRTPPRAGLGTRTATALSATGSNF